MVKWSLGPACRHAHDPTRQNNSRLNAHHRRLRCEALEDGHLLTVLLKILLAGPLKAGYRTDLWTCPRVADLIAKKFHVKFHPAHVWKILRGFGWTPQKPEQRARERNEKAIRWWREENWPRIKRGQSVS